MWVYPEDGAGEDSGIAQKMSAKYPGEKEKGKRRKTEERTGEFMSSQNTDRSSHVEMEDHFKSQEDPFQREATFEEVATQLTAKKWVGACDVLATQMTESIYTIDKQRMKAPREPCEECEEMAAYSMIMASMILKKTQCALREYSRRYRKALREVDSEAAAKEEMALRSSEQEEEARRLAQVRDQLLTEKEQETLRSKEQETRLKGLMEEKKEVERERDELRAALSTRRETERMELEEEATSPTAGDTIPPALLRALEGWFERRWERAVSHRNPPPPAEKEGARPGSWAKAVSRKAGSRSSPAGTTRPNEGKGEGTPGKKKTGKRWPTLPKSAVVAINPLPGGEHTGRELIREAQQALSLEKLEVPPLEIKRSRMGGYLLAVRGEGAEEGADRLARGLRGMPQATKVAITRPAKRCEMRVSGLDEGVSPTEVVQAVAAAGGCPVEEVKPGDIRCTSTGMGALWIRCPAAAAIKVAKAGGVRVGWAWAPVGLLTPRPQRCFRCLETGHLRIHCASPVDRSARCYRCGDRKSVV